MLSFQMDDVELVEALDALDRQFDRLTLEAMRLAEQYRQVGAERKILLPVLISVTQDKRYRSTSIRWGRVVPLAKDSERSLTTKPMRKGRDTFKYPDSAFDFIEPSIRSVVLLYEERLEILRFLLSKNRSAYSTIRNTSIGFHKLLSPIQDAD